MTKFKNIGVIALLFLGLIVQCTQAPVESPLNIQQGKNLDSLQAGVACAYPDASRIGANILAKGGNAVDASIAVQWALAVCYPRAGNIGGGGFMVVRMADGSSATLDFREKAPGGAHEKVFQDSLGNVIAGKSRESVYAAGVPGTVRGLFDAHKKYGHLPMEDLINPAIDLAINGYALTATEAAMLNYTKDIFLERNGGETPFTRDQPWTEGDTLRQSELAATLTRIRDLGPDDFYNGATAQMIVATMGQSQGAISMKDLADYKAIWREPIRHDFGQYKVISMPPPSSGGVAISQLLTMYNDCIETPLPHNGPDYIHALVEMQRRVYADRSEHLGDPDFWDVPIAELTDLDYLRSRMDNFKWHIATPSEKVKPGTFALAESMETTHLSVVDVEGNAVSVTTTLNDNYGSKIVVGGAGFLLNNEMDDFSSKPGEPNMFGLVGGDANAIKPGKRMLSSMTPVIVEKNGELYLVAGSPGGATIITSVFQTILNTAVYNYPLQKAIALPKFHSQWLPDEIVMEKGRFGDSTIVELTARKHIVQFAPSLGRVDAILVNGDGTIQVSGDPRGDNAATGF